MPISVVVWKHPSTPHGTGERLEFDIVSRRHPRCHEQCGTSRDQKQLHLHGYRGAWLHWGWNKAGTRRRGLDMSTLDILSPSKKRRFNR